MEDYPCKFSAAQGGGSAGFLHSRAGRSPISRSAWRTLSGRFPGPPASSELSFRLPQETGGSFSAVRLTRLFGGRILRDIPPQGWFRYTSDRKGRVSLQDSAFCYSQRFSSFSSRIAIPINKSSISLIHEGAKKGPELKVVRQHSSPGLEGVAVRMRTTY